MAAEAREEMNHFNIKGREIEVVFAQERRKTPNEMRGRGVNQQNHRSDDTKGGNHNTRKERSSSFERHMQQQQANSKSKDSDDKDRPDKEDWSLERR